MSMGVNCSQCVSIENKRLKSTLDDQQTKPCHKLPPCIYKVPGKLRDANAAAYTPRLISIGPFHYGQPELKDMQTHKDKYSERFLKRFATEVPPLVDQLKNTINDSKRDISSCYAGTIDEEKLVDIILVDACFIFELFWMNYYCELECHDDDYILGSPWLKKAIELELILFENQLPYYLFLRLYQHAFPLLSRFQNSQDRPCSSSSYPLLEEAQHEHKLVIKDEARPIKDEARPTFIELTYKFFEDFCKPRESFMDGQVIPKHFTDLIRHFMLPETTIRRKMTWDDTIKCKYSLKMLTTAGVNVSFVEDNKHSTADVKAVKRSLVVRITDDHGADRGALKPKTSITPFGNINLELTSIEVKDDTECLVRNVMALEQFVYPKEAYICNYFLVMDKLVDTVEDVDFLVEMGVIINMLGSNVAVAKLLNNLCEHIMEDKSCYNHICKKLNHHYECSYNRHLVSLKRVYFKDVWTGSATFFGVILVLLTIIQIIMSFKASNVK